MYKESKNKKTIIALVISVMMIIVFGILFSGRLPKQRDSGVRELFTGLGNAISSIGNGLNILAGEVSGTQNSFDQRYEAAINSGENFMIKPNGSIIMLGEKSSKTYGDEMAFIYLMQKNEKICKASKEGTSKYFEKYFEDTAQEKIVKDQNCAGFGASEFYGVYKLQDSESFQFVYLVGDNEDALKESMSEAQKYSSTLNTFNDIVLGLGEMLTPDK